MGKTATTVTETANGNGDTVRRLTITTTIDLRPGSSKVHPPRIRAIQNEVEHAVGKAMRDELPGVVADVTTDARWTYELFQNASKQVIGADDQGM